SASSWGVARAFRSGAWSCWGRVSFMGCSWRADQDGVTPSVGPGWMGAHRSSARVYPPLEQWSVVRSQESVFGSSPYSGVSEDKAPSLWLTPDPLTPTEVKTPTAGRTVRTDSGLLTTVPSGAGPDPCRPGAGAIRIPGHGDP